jgi:hypothetical protein
MMSTSVKSNFFPSNAPSTIKALRFRHAIKEANLQRHCKVSGEEMLSKNNEQQMDPHSRRKIGLTRVNFLAIKDSSPPQEMALPSNMITSSRSISVCILVTESSKCYSARADGLVCRPSHRILV